MAYLDTAANCLTALYRLVGTVSSDDALVENSESADQVAYTCLTHGFEEAQQFMIGCGMSERWRTRGTAITSWSGADATDGGRYKALSSVIASSKEFLRFAGKKYDAVQSSLVTANGERWGVEIDADNDALTGDFYYLKNEELWLCRGAAVPATIYAEYQFRHPEFTSSVTINFPADARGLGIAYAALHGMAEGWYPRADDTAITKNVEFWEKKSRKIARRSRGPRTQTPPTVIGTRFFA